VLLVALKIATVFAPFRVSPVTELVVKVPLVLIKPSAFGNSARGTDCVRFTAPLPAAASVPVMLIAPVLFIVSVPPPDCSCGMVSVVAVLVSAILPLVLLVHGSCHRVGVIQRFTRDRIGGQ